MSDSSRSRSTNLISPRRRAPPADRIALPRNHPLADRARVPLHALAHEPHIMFARRMGPRLYDAVLGACRGGLHHAHRSRSGQPPHRVRAGRGRPRRVLRTAGIQEKRSTGIILRPVSPTLPHVESQLAIAYKPQSCELVSLFVDVVREVMATRRSRHAFLGSARLRPSASRRRSRSSRR